MRFNNQNGQALLIVVLVMVVALTVTLSLVSRSVINLRTSTEQATSQAALAAAEAGIEKALVGLRSGSDVSIGETNLPGLNAKIISTNITAVSGGSFLVNGGSPVIRHSGGTIWLSPYSESGSISPWPAGGATATVNIRWGQDGVACNNSAIEIVVVSGTAINNATARRYAVDPCVARRNQNNFNDPVVNDPISISGETLTYRASISVTNGIIIKVIPLYFDTKIGVTSTTSMPSQGSIIESIGQSDETQRKVTVFQGYPELPTELFPFSLLSP